MSSRKLQIIVVVAAIVLTVGLLLAPSQVNVTSKQMAHQAQSEQHQEDPAFNGDALLKSAKGALNKEQIAQLDHLELGLKQSAGDKDTALLDEIGRFWDRQSIPAASAVWFERKAKVMNTDHGYLDAAYRYFDSFKLAQDSGLREMMVQKAISNYQKVLELNPNNLDAKTDLGACYAEGTGEPMKGIMLLREVIAANPNHEMAQYNLGMLSVKSGQLDKAIVRFQKVLEINPKRSDMYLFLGQIYLQMGDTTNAISNYQTFTKKSDDYQAVTQIGKMVDDLKKEVHSR